MTEHKPEFVKASNFLVNVSNITYIEDRRDKPIPGAIEPMRAVVYFVGGSLLMLNEEQFQALLFQTGFGGTQGGFS